MLLRSSLDRVLFAGASLMVLALAGAGCGGCNDSHLNCDDNGENCLICDAYGCRPADPDNPVSGTPGSTTGQGGNGPGGAGTGAVGGETTTGGGGAGGAPCDSTVTTCPCQGEGECSGDLQCVDGLCINGCNFTYECGAGKVCANGKCVAGCDETTPCANAYVCDKGVCVPDPNNPECTDRVPCATGVCKDGICSTECTTNDQCTEGQICDSIGGVCILDPSPTAGCGPNTPCFGAQLCAADGYCHYPCTTVPECKLIDNRFDYCDAGICKTEEEVNPQCTIDNPCPPGQDCISNKCL